MKKLAGYLIFIFLVSGIFVVNSCKKDPVIATLTTTAVTNITINSVTSGGVITKDGGAAVTARGVCWSQVSDPSITEEHTTDDKGIGSFVSNITGLTPNTLYHIRAYATNSAGTAYGEDISFTTTPIVVPSLTTAAITSIALTTAVSGGNIISDGHASITAKGVCWSTSTTPTTANSFTTDGSGSGSFVSNLTGLSPATTYYVRAYATNSAGTAYGNELSFTTTQIVVPTLTTATVSSVTLTTAVAGGNITNDGGGPVTAKGTCWSTSANPTVSDSKTSDGTGTGSFTSILSGLTAGTTYHIRSYATNSAGTAYGEDLTFTTNPIVIPTLTTTAASLVTLTSAVTGGNITSDGGGTVTARGVCWSTAANPSITGSKTSDATGTGSFISTLTGLVPGVTYHIRAYATNSAGTAYGNDLTFTTNPVSIPTLTTTAATSITLTTAVSGGNITSDGGGSVTAKGVCWSTTSGPTTASPKTSDGTGTGSFTSNLASLLPATTYYIRAYATNSAGTAYGNEVSFTTSQIVVPTLTTTVVSSITTTSAASGGNITSNGGGAVTVRGVCWSTAATPTTSNFTSSDGTGSGIFSSSITGLTPGTTYHVRAYATNSAGTAYGNELTFTTSAGVPTLTTTAANSITSTSAVSGGNITADNGAAVTVRGTCWSLTANPTTADSHTADGTGTGVFTSSLTALAPGTTYHIRAYATNSAGTAYGSDLTFTTAVAVPTLTTTAASAITLTTATAGGNITANGGGAVSARGTCWSTSLNPSITDSHTSDGTGNGVFTSSLTGLTAGTTYHIRSYATNSAGTAYGNDLTFTTTAPSAATISTTAISSVTLTTAVAGGNITSNGGATVTLSGLCWSTNTNPTIADPHSTDGSAIGSFSSTLNGLTKGTVYYVRAYATNIAGTAYGNQLTFGSDIDDVDGNVYGTTVIGTQLWMSENLKTTLYNNSSPIPNVTASTGAGSWSAITTPAYCWFNNDGGTYKNLYGAIYNWYAVNTGNLCPSGWHVPTDAEFGDMESALGMPPADLTLFGVYRGVAQLVGTQLKNTSGWATGENGSNTSGFSALPGGYRYYADGTFQALGSWSYWWSSDIGNGSETWYRRIDGTNNGVFRNAVDYKAGKYVRCVK